ncbi:type I-E CRISPR-associated protein Cas5/CasD [Nocardia sp. NEAU-G5]|uniref:Type I-E CRISPR-associated protein Cas5/CasD n=1 Tax=Nocardia albiluteola TaxID=2842303 RepID=A0ABS6AYS6_9NOCA|nr:type I-E CRISPR-associated protein Cas5/CasD [Nocardia albiluteola]MBU3063159.1 type I-E CRISPR-associated protein Cas5/CasD [Nocardia albiluteola]
MSGLILRLAAPLQSWGEHSAFSLRDTQRFPTRSGLIGMFASAHGLRRGEPLTEFDSLHLSVRIDRPGAVITDFHTIGGGHTPADTVKTAAGSRRTAGKGTIVTRRNYLSDAVFTVGVAGPHETLSRLADALAAPHWQPYLGRRSCPPEQPLLLRTDVHDPLHDLKYTVPIHGAQRATIDLVTETPGQDDEGHDRDSTITELLDVPETFEPQQRRYRSRSVTVTPFTKSPNELWHKEINEFYTALFRYMGVS